MAGLVFSSSIRKYYKIALIHVGLIAKLLNNTVVPLLRYQAIIAYDMVETLLVQAEVSIREHTLGTPRSR